MKPKGGKVERFKDYQGRLVRLTTERWHHILEHSEMQQQKNKLRTTLADPDRVFTSHLDPTVHLYYRQFSMTPVGAKHLMAAVKVLGNDAFVITAFFTSEVKGGTEVWAK